MTTERLYRNDSFLTSFEAVVTDIREYSRENQQTLWQIALDRSAFYPTGGGQPFDLGCLRATSRGGSLLELPIVNVEEDEQGEVWHFVQKPVLPGTAVQGVLDWRRRLDHMQQHSGQHLLSAVFARELGALTLSFHMGQELSSIDLDSAQLSESDLERIEQTANLLIAEDRPVSLVTMSRAEAEAELAAGSLRKLPPREGSLRIVVIEDYDRNACGGTHVRSTGQIGGLLLRGTEKVSRGLRVNFVCGLRAVAAARQDAALLAQAAQPLSIGIKELPTAVERLRAETKSSAKELQKLREELAQEQAARLAGEIATQTIVAGRVRWFEHNFAGRDRESLRLLAASLATASPHTLILLHSIQGETGSVVLARSADIDLHCGQTMRQALEALGLRGGGSPTLAQADLPASLVEKLCETLTALTQAWSVGRQKN